MEWWQLGIVANAVLLLAYLAISWTILSGLARSGEPFRSNPLALATGLIFFTCGVGHGLHLEHLIADPVARVAHDWHLGSWDLITAAVGTWYWTLRGRFPALVRGAALYDDLQVRQRQALEIHDSIVQGLAAAKLAFELDAPDEGLAHLDTTLASSRRIITEMLGDESVAPLRPGGLRRSLPSG